MGLKTSNRTFLFLYIKLKVLLIGFTLKGINLNDFFKIDPFRRIIGKYYV